MQNLYCITHSKYDGKSTPNLLCKSCCSIYVNAIKHETEEKLFESRPIEREVPTKKLSEWLLDKSQSSKR